MAPVLVLSFVFGFARVEALVVEGLVKNQESRLGPGLWERLMSQGLGLR